MLQTNKVLKDLFSGDPRSIIMKCKGNNENMQPYLIYLFILNNIYLKGCPVQQGWFEWGADENKKTTQNNNNR